MFALTLVEMLGLEAPFVQANYDRLLEGVVNILKMTSEGKDKIL